jgi:hypothetical protein
VLLPPALWHRSRLWWCASSNPLLQRLALPAHSARAARVTAQCDLGQPRLAFLSDHGVLGQPCVPASALLDLASAIGQLLWSAEQLDSQVTTAGVVFSSPAQLPTGVAPLLSCTVDLRSGAVAVTSSGSAAVPHLQAGLSATAQAAPASLGPALPRTWHKEGGGAQLPRAGVAQVLPGVPSALLGAPYTCGGAGGTGCSGALASLLVHQHRHAGYQTHPAVAGASLQLAVAIALGPVQGSGALQAVSMAAYQALQPLREGHASVGASVADAWLAGCGGARLAAFVGPRFRALVEGSPAAYHAQTTGLRRAASGGHLPVAVPGAAPVLAGDVALRLADLVAGLIGTRVEEDQPLMEAGLDSIGRLAADSAALPVMSWCACRSASEPAAPFEQHRCPFLLVQGQWSSRMQWTPRLGRSCRPR